MSAKGCCYDNACAESFFHSLKVECIHGERFISREIIRTTVFNYIECDYNRWHRHSSCGGVSPPRLGLCPHYVGSSISLQSEEKNLRYAHHRENDEIEER